MTHHDLRNADCIQELAWFDARSVDCVITDPPYSDWVHKNQFRTEGKTIIGGELSFSSLREEDRSKLAAHFARISRRWIVVFCALEDAHLWRACLEGGGARYIRTLVWVKPDAMPQWTGDRPGTGYEVAILAHPPDTRMAWNGQGRSAVYTFNKIGPHDQTRLHETQKPLALMEALIRDFSDRGETVLDPFMGSGTTGVAAMKLGRRFIGMELDKDYYAIARKRIEGATEQLDFFDRGNDGLEREGTDGNR